MRMRIYLVLLQTWLLTLGTISRARSQTTDLPPDTTPTAGGFTNCKDLLDGEAQLLWDVDGDDVKFKLSARMAENEWAAIGVSGNVDMTQMVGGDPTVIFYTAADETFHAVDYILLDKSECDGETGSCPDVRVGGEDNVKLISGSRNNGVTSVIFKRPIAAMDTSDLEIRDEILLINAIGTLNDKNEVSYHRTKTDPAGTIKISPMESGYWNCSNLLDNGNEETTTTEIPATGRDKEFTNCRDLLDGAAQLLWNGDEEDSVKFKLSGRMGENDWIAVGPSGAADKTKMIRGDPVVVYYKPADGSFHAEDYHLLAQGQCDGKSGACPDTKIGGTNDVKLISGTRKNGVTTVVFTRPKQSSDSLNDRPLEEDTVIISAIGPLNSRDEVDQHSIHTNQEDVISIKPLGSDDWTCGKLLEEKDDKNSTTGGSWPVFRIRSLFNFTARIGPNGGDRGYSAMTDIQAWQVSWWINDILIPEITVERGMTYNFYVEGGDDPTNSALYHPFYITDSPEGGYGQKSDDERGQEKVYAGVDMDSSRPTAVGRLCEWGTKAQTDPASFDTFEEYKKTLKLVCGKGEPSLLSWTVQDDAPDLLYYQCYTHDNMGWKIHVGEPTGGSTPPSWTTTTTTEDPSPNPGGGPGGRTETNLRKEHVRKGI